MIYALMAATAGSFVLLLVNVDPGISRDVAQLAVFTSCLWLPAAGVGGIWLLARLSRMMDESSARGGVRPAGSAKPSAPRRRWAVVAAAILASNLALTAGQVPRRLAFALARPAFEAQLAAAPTSRAQGMILGRRLGIYHVDRLTADPRGGVYFRTHAGVDGLGPDTLSSGFAFRPNPEGTPFGRAGYEVSHLFGDWYSFEASNDY